MKAFAVELPPGTIEIRTGIGCDVWGVPADFRVNMLPDGKLSGLTKEPENDDVGKFTSHHMRAIKKLVEGELGRVWHWDRLNHDNHRTVRSIQMFAVNIQVKITDNGKGFADYNLSYMDMSYEKMQLLTATITAALIGLGDENKHVEETAAKKK